MSNQGIGNFMVNEDEISGTSLDIFSSPDTERSFVSGKEVEIRLFTILER